MSLFADYQQTKIKVGDFVRVKYQYFSGTKTQTQSFSGLVIAIKGRESQKTFMVRKIGADGIGVEKIWPIASPNLIKIDLVKPGNIRRAKLYYLRQRIGKEALATKSQ